MTKAIHFIKRKEATMLDLKYEFLCDVEADLEEPIDVGSTPHGVRMIYNIRGVPLRAQKLAARCFPPERIGLSSDLIWQASLMFGL